MMTKIVTSDQILLLYPMCSFNMQKYDSIAIGEPVLDAFIQRYCLHGISSMLYNFKQQTRYFFVNYYTSEV